jgi:hypothetical protein
MVTNDIGRSSTWSFVMLATLFVPLRGQSEYGQVRSAGRGQLLPGVEMTSHWCEECVKRRKGTSLNREGVRRV